MTHTRKVRETRHVPEGFAGRYETRVRLLGKREAPPEGAEVVDPETPEHDWRPRDWPQKG